MLYSPHPGLNGAETGHANILGEDKSGVVMFAEIVTSALLQVYNIIGFLQQESEAACCMAKRELVPKKVEKGDFERNVNYS